MMLEVRWMSAMDRENVAHLLATMHLVLRQHDRHRYRVQPHRHLTNLAYEKFVERYLLETFVPCFVGKKLFYGHRIVYRSLVVQVISTYSVINNGWLSCAF